MAPSATLPFFPPNQFVTHLLLIYSHLGHHLPLLVVLALLLSPSYSSALLSLGMLHLLTLLLLLGLLGHVLLLLLMVVLLSTSMRPSHVSLSSSSTTLMSHPSSSVVASPVTSAVPSTSPSTTPAPGTSTMQWLIVMGRLHRNL